MELEEKDREKLRKFGLSVRNMRKKLGISQEELGFLSGLDRTYIGGIERGERNLTLLKILRIAKALQQPVQILFGEFKNGEN